MCTVSFLPRPDGGYLLATNRDESPRRAPARPPELRQFATHGTPSQDAASVLSPIDGEAGGTWVALDDRGRALCLLNGDRPGLPAPLEAPSRGLLVSELMQRATLDSVLSALRQRRARGRLLEKAFKLLVVEPGDDRQGARCAHLEWDGTEVRLVAQHTGPFALVSSSFDPEGVAARRERSFRSLAALAQADEAKVRQAQALFHASHQAGAPAGDAYSVCMHRAEACTVSFTQVVVEARSASMGYQPGSPCLGAPSVCKTLARVG